MSSKNWHIPKEELYEWLAAMKNVIKLTKGKDIVPAPLRLDLEVNTSNVTQQKTQTQSLQRLLTLNDKSNIDHRTINKIDSGNYDIDIELDLHGYTINQSFNLLEKTIIGAWQSNLRMILVITGKGRSGDRDTIRSLLPSWINLKNIAPYILRFSTATQRHGGKGAFYILLKKNRNKD